MKEAIANAGVFNLIITFVIILLSFFIGSISYSKAYKIKNRIIDEIEKERGYEGASDSIEFMLGELGYRKKTIDSSFECGIVDNKFVLNNGESINKSSDYQYCVYKFNTCNNENCDKYGVYYKVVAYMYFDIPIINELLRIPVTGETITFTTIES